MINTGVQTKGCLSLSDHSIANPHRSRRNFLQLIRNGPKSPGEIFHVELLQTSFAVTSSGWHAEKLNVGHGGFMACPSVLAYLFCEYLAHILCCRNTTMMNTVLLCWCVCLPRAPVSHLQCVITITPQQNNLYSLLSRQPEGATGQWLNSTAVFISSLWADFSCLPYLYLFKSNLLQSILIL